MSDDLEDAARLLVRELAAQGNDDHDFALMPRALQAYDALALILGEEPWVEVKA